MSINFNTLAPISATVLSLGGLVFQIGKHSEKLDLLNNKVYAQEKKVDENYKYINDMKIFIDGSKMDTDKSTYAPLGYHTISSASSLTKSINSAICS